METNFPMETKIYLRATHDHVLKRWLAGDLDLSSAFMTPQGRQD